LNFWNQPSPDNQAESAHQGQIGSLQTNANKHQHQAMKNLTHGKSTDVELLAAVIRSNNSNGSGQEVAIRLIQRFGNLRSLLHADNRELLACRGIGQARLAALKALPELARRYFEESLPSGESIRSPRDTESFLKARMQHLDHELFCCLYLDNRHRVLRFDELFRGTIDGTSVYPREVVKEALSVNAAAVILAHNRYLDIKCLFLLESRRANRIWYPQEYPLCSI